MSLVTLFTFDSFAIRNLGSTIKTLCKIRTSYLRELRILYTGWCVYGGASNVCCILSYALTFLVHGKK